MSQLSRNRIVSILRITERPSQVKQTDARDSLNPLLRSGREPGWA